MNAKLGALLLAACAASSAYAKVDATQAARLGTDLTRSAPSEPVMPAVPFRRGAVA